MDQPKLDRDNSKEERGHDEPERDSMEICQRCGDKLNSIHIIGGLCDSCREDMFL